MDDGSKRFDCGCVRVIRNGVLSGWKESQWSGLKVVCENHRLASERYVGGKR